MNKGAFIIMTLFFTLATFVSGAQALTPEQVDTAKVYRSLEKALQHPDRVYRLDLTRQKLKEVPKEVFLLPYLHELILDRNKIEVIPQDINKLSYLQHLSITRNELTEVPNEICALTKLRVLNLGENYIEELPQDMDRMVELRELILWSNMLGELPFSLVLLEHLEHIDLLHNEMNAEEQRVIRDMLPNSRIELSTPCICNFDDD
jgi:Leucine-rich repeat (LRR) protein